MNDSLPISANLFEECCQRLIDGETVAECLARYPDEAPTLAPLIQAVAAVRELRPVPTRDPAVAVARRREFLAALNEAPAPQSLPVWTQLKSAWEALVSGMAARQPMPVGLAVILVAVLLIGVLSTGAVTASASALPGDVLYPVKLVTEQARTLIVQDPAARAALANQILATRVQEALAIMQKHRSVREMPFAGVLQDVEATRWQVSGISVLITRTTVIQGQPAVGSLVRGEVQAPGDGTLVGLRLEVVPAPAGTAGAGQPGPSPTPEPSPTATLDAGPAVVPDRPTARPTRTPTRLPPTHTPTRVVEALPTSEFLWSPIDTPTPTPTATFTRPPRPTATPTVKPTRPRPVVKARVIGYVEVIDGSWWTISGTTVDTDASTQYVGKPSIGDKVTAVVALRLDDTYLALSITANRPAQPTPEPVQFTERLQAKSGSRWTIGGTVVIVSASTVLAGDPQVGDLVEFKGVRSSSGIQALSIKSLVLPEVSLDGVLQTMAGGRWVIDGTTVYVDSTTQVQGEPAVGLRVQVVAQRMPDGHLAATMAYVVP